MTTPRPRILVVDDELAVTESLGRALRWSAREFDVVTASSGAEALDVLHATPCAVVVSDLRMRGMTGIELFATMARQMPAIGRVLLTGTADAKATMLAIPVSHRFLCKPCSSKTLAETCRGVYHYRGSCEAGSVVALGVDAETVAAAGAPGQRWSAMRAAIAAHPALVAGLLHAVGSEFLGSTTKVTTLDEALEVIGPSGFRLLLGSEIFQVVEGAAATPIIALATEARHRAAMIASRGGSPTAVLAAFVADVDRLGSLDPVHWSGLREGGDAATLLGLWGASSQIVDHISLETRGSTGARRVTRHRPPEIADGYFTEGNDGRTAK